MPFSGNEFNVYSVLAEGSVTGGDGTLSTPDTAITNVRNGTGDHTLTIKNWPEWAIIRHVLVVLKTGDRSYRVATNSLTNTTLTVQIVTRTADPTAGAAANADCDFDFLVIGLRRYVPS
jgi:hypothetical protein